MRRLRQAQLKKIREDIEKERQAAENEFLRNRFLYLSQYFSEFLDQQLNQPTDRLLKVKLAQNITASKVISSSEVGVGPSEIPQNILEEKARTINQQVSLIRNVAGFVEKELHLDATRQNRSKNRITNHSDGIAKDEKKTLSLKALKQQWQLFNNFSLNMDYQASKLLSVSEKVKELEQSQQSKQFQHRLFECAHTEDLTSKIERVSISSKSIQLLNWLYYFENKSKPIDELIVCISSFQNNADYFKFDDALATLFIAKPHCHFKKLFIKFEINTQELLIVLRLLLFVKSCNIIQIVPQTRSDMEETEENIELLKQIFYLIFSMKNLQEIEIQNIGIILPELTAGLVRADPKTSNISSVIMKDNYTLNEQNTSTILLADYFESMSQLPRLINFECSSLKLTGYRQQQSFSRFVEKLQFAQMDLKLNRYFSPHLPLSNLIRFQGTIVLEQNDFINERFNQLLSSFKDALQLQSFELVTSVDHNENYKSRKEILNEAKNKKAKGNEGKSKKKAEIEKLLKIDNKQPDQEKENRMIVEENNQKEININEFEVLEEEQAIVEEVDEVEIDFSNYALENPKWFGHLKNKSNLRTFQVKISQINKDIYESLVDFLQMSTHICQFDFQCPQHEVINDEEKQDCQQTNINFKQLYLIINDLVYIRNFHFKVNEYQIQYTLPNEKATEYDLRLTSSLILSKRFAATSFLEFSLEKVRSITVNIGQIYGLRMLDILLKSVSNSKIVKKLEINITSFKGLKKSIERCPRNNAEFLFFNHFDSLNFVEHLKLKIPVNQHVLNSISGFLRGSLELKSFIFKRTSPELKQYYLNYSGFLAAISESKSLQQLFFSTGIEMIPNPREIEYRSSWHSDKLAHFYYPLSLLLRNAPESLRTIEFEEQQSNKEGLKLVIEALIQAPILLYTKFDQSTTIMIQFCQDNAFIELYNEAISYGIIVKPSYRFPLTQDTTFVQNTTCFYQQYEERQNQFNDEDAYVEYILNQDQFQKQRVKICPEIYTNYSDEDS